MDPGYWSDLVAPVFRGRPWLVATDAGAGATPTVAWLRELGAPRPLVLCATPGVGDLPPAEDAEMISLDLKSDSIVHSIKAFIAASRDLPAHVVAAVDDWDPAGRAQCLVMHVDTEGTIAGRPSYGARPATWEALEDKLAAEDVWRAAGIATAPHRVVPADREALVGAHTALDAGHGTMWAADNRHGWHGGGESLRRVRTNEDRDEAVAFMAEEAHRVRVMPFLEGIPCSVTGMVVGDEVISFRPAEMLVLRVPGSARLRYCGTATFWDPPDAGREEMRRAAVAVGRALRRDHGYRGLFTVDGVMTKDGFRPTELNPRIGGSAGALVRGLEPPIPLMNLNRCVIAGEDLDYRPEALEEVIVRGADAHRMLRGISLVTMTVEGEGEEIGVVFEGGACRPAPDGSEPHGTLSLGPSTTGGAVFLRMESGAIGPGPSSAGHVAAAYALADEMWGTGIGPLEPAVDVTKG